MPSLSSARYGGRYSNVAAFPAPGTVGASLPSGVICQHIRDRRRSILGPADLTCQSRATISGTAQPGKNELPSAGSQYYNDGCRDKNTGRFGKAWSSEAGKWMRRLSSRYIRTFRIFTLTLLGCLAAERPGRRGHNLQALLVQSGVRRNAENSSETVPESARGMQRFLTDSPWDDDAAIGRRSTWRPNRSTLGRCGCWIAATISSQGVARQYCGRLGKVANCQAGMILACVSPLGRALEGKRIYLPESWTSDKDRCAAAGIPGERRSYRSKTGLALEMPDRAVELGHLKAGWVVANDAFGMSPSFREGLATLGMRYVLGVPAGFTVRPVEPGWTNSGLPGTGWPSQAHAGGRTAAHHGGAQ